MAAKCLFYRPLTSRTNCYFKKAIFLSFNKNVRSDNNSLLRHLKAEDMDSTVFKNVGRKLPLNTTSHPKDLNLPQHRCGTIKYRCVYVCIYVCMYVYVCMYACMQVCMYVVMCINIFIFYLSFYSQDAPLHSNTQHASLHTNAQHAPLHSNTKHAPLHSNTQHAPLHSNTQHAPLHSNTTCFGFLILKYINI